MEFRIHRFTWPVRDPFWWNLWVPGLWTRDSESTGWNLESESHQKIIQSPVMNYVNEMGWSWNKNYSVKLYFSLFWSNFPLRLLCFFLSSLMFRKVRPNFIIEKLNWFTVTIQTIGIPVLKKWSRKGKDGRTTITANLITKNTVSISPAAGGDLTEKITIWPAVRGHSS